MTAGSNPASTRTQCHVDALAKRRCQDPFGRLRCNVAYCGTTVMRVFDGQWLIRSFASAFSILFLDATCKRVGHA